MPELAFHDHHNRRLRSIHGGGSGGGGDACPDSVIFPYESSFSLFSSSASNTSLQSSSGGFRGSDPDLKKEFTARNIGGPYLLGKKVEKAEAIKQYIDAENQNQTLTLSSARSSFSYKEYQNQKLRSDRRRPASLDLNNQSLNVTSSSPRLISAMKTSASAQRTPNYQKGWSSERVPLHTNTNRSTLMVYNNNNGKVLSSKWEDAERWIISPVAGDNGLNRSGQRQKRAKSKSGPLGPHGSESPVLTGVNVDYGSLIQYQNGRDNNGNVSSVMDHCIATSVSLHGCSEVLSHHSLLQLTEDVSRRDMATQMSPESSPGSSPTKPTPSSILTVDLQHARCSKSDIKDVQMDDQVTLTPYSGSNIEVARKNKGSIVKTSLSKVQREEAKITAWENLQKAKADAAMRKLEMKLEKKRSSSMDRITHKLQSAQEKAQEMRESVLSNEPHRVDKPSHKTVSLTRHVRFLTGCFTRPAL